MVEEIKKYDAPTTIQDIEVVNTYELEDRAREKPIKQNYKKAYYNKL